MEQTTTAKTWTYTTDGEKYDVLKLPDEGQQAIKLMIELDSELKTLNRQRAIYNAAAAQLNAVVQNSLHEEALIEEEEEEDSTTGGGVD